MKRLLGIAAISIAVLLVLAFAFCRGIFVSEAVAYRALEAHGFSDVRITGSAWFFMAVRGGSEHDAARFDCEATNPAGKRTKVYVYAGWPFKNATVRTD